MEPYRAQGPFERYDYHFMKKVLKQLSPAFYNQRHYDYILSDVMKYFADNTIHYSDETYDPNALIRRVDKLSQKIMRDLEQFGLFVDGYFPYSFYELSPDLAMILRYSNFTGRRY